MEKEIHEFVHWPFGVSQRGCKMKWNRRTISPPGCLHNFVATAANPFQPLRPSVPWYTLGRFCRCCFKPDPSRGWCHRSLSSETAMQLIAETRLVLGREIRGNFALLSESRRFNQRHPPTRCRKLLTKRTRELRFPWYPGNWRVPTLLHGLSSLPRHSP